MTSNAKTVVRDAAIVYGLTFAAGLGMVAGGITIETNSSTAYLWNLLSGVLGFTLVGARISPNRAEHLTWVAATLWTFNLSNIALGVQSSSVACCRFQRHRVRCMKEPGGGHGATHVYARV